MRWDLLLIILYIDNSLVDNYTWPCQCDSLPVNPSTLLGTRSRHLSLVTSARSGNVFGLTHPLIIAKNILKWSVYTDKCYAKQNWQLFWNMKLPHTYILCFVLLGVQASSDTIHTEADKDDTKEEAAKKCFDPCTDNALHLTVQHQVRCVVCSRGGWNCQAQLQPQLQLQLELRWD